MKKAVLRTTLILMLAGILTILAACADGGVQTPASGAQTPDGETTDGSGCVHQYVFEGFEWKSADEADAVYVCQKDASHISRRRAEVTTGVLSEATSVKTGVKRSVAREGGREETREMTYMAPEVTLTVYSVNDFHGAVSADDSQTGLGRFASFFKAKGEDGNTLLVDVGDTWQGSILSNYNSGRMICDVYNYVGFDAKVVGNHDFDWGPEVLEENAAFTSYGRKTPFLAANVYDFDFQTKKQGRIQQEQFGAKSVTYTMASGLKVGIVGLIGEDQITSINSLYTQDICFTDHVKVIKEEARALRSAGCDVVICAIHAAQDEVLGKRLGDYVDLVLCAHSHQLEHTYEGDLLFAQFRSNGEYFGEITLTFDTEKKRATSALKNLSAADVARETPFADLELLALIDRYGEECRAEAGVVVANNVKNSFSSPELPDLMCRAMYDACRKAGYDVCLTYVNKGRKRLSAGTWTYEDLYEAFPFDDLVYIAEVTGREILDQIGNYNYMYRSPEMEDGIDPDATYLIGVADYLLFHTDTARRFNYFPKSAANVRGLLNDNYRVILRDWLLENGYADGKELSAADFGDSLRQHDRNAFYEKPQN
ncbi:MAG: bifunctional metallophosphatase/5'-nucleotidase [Clostridia bacterium]|nr:bifunctional metallophosphatase/5'-nucleotidase [Clostridia bacterium]